MADPKIRYDIEANVAGDAEVGQLANRIEQLAGTLDGDLKASALASADALRQLAQKDGAIQNFVDLKREAQQAATGLQDTQAAAQKLGSELAAVEKPTRAQAGQLQKLRDAVRDAKTEVVAKTAALMQARGGLEQYGISTDNLSQSQRNIKTAINAARTEVDAIAASHTKATAAAKTAAEEQNRLAAAVAASNAKATAAAQLAADQQNKIAAAVAVSNAKAVEMAKSAAAAREQVAERALASERKRQQFVESYQYKEDLAQQTLLARSREIAAQYPRLAAAAETAGQKQVQANKQVESGLDSLKNQLTTLRNIAVSALGGSYVGSLAKDVAETADAYNNLQARIKLVTGEGAAFKSAFEGVTAVSQRTSTSLEATGTLFSKLLESGKAMGVGQAQALKLTETVNQAIQLSGATAQASDAAVVQLIQGLQSGVLRGDEFNSVMEQSPRLAKALADGLSTTTGELRKMAEAGQLSSETVIKALQGQADMVASEFSKLPPTVGRAIQNLSTSWTLYVGETDKATGASSAAASAINLLSGNLSTVAGFLLDAGQAAAGFVAIKLAQHFLGIGVAATQATTAVVANTAAVNASSTASAAAAVNVGRLASILSSLKLLSLVGIVTNFKDIGTAIGEAVAKLMGYKDRTEELARAEKVAAEIAADAAAMRKRMADATQAAIDKQFELSVVAKTAITDFDKLTKEGMGAAEAVAKIGKDFDLASIPGIKNATAVLDKLAADGKISAGQFQQAWADALKDEDLAVFEAKARAAFAGTAREVERLKQLAGVELQEAVRRTGLDFDVISGGMGKASRSAINDTEIIITGLDKLKAKGVDTAQALTASIGKSISTADSQKAIDALRQQIESMRKVLGDKVADGLLDQAKQKGNELKDALDNAKPGITSLREAMKELGLQSRDELDATAKKAQEAYALIKAKGQEEGESYVAWQARKQDAARAMLERLIAANGGVITEAIKARAAMEGIDLSSEKAGRSMKNAFDSGSEAASRFTHNAGASLEEIARMDAALDAINGKYGQSKAHRDGTYKLDEQTKAKPGQIDLSLATKLLDAANSGRPVDMTASEYAQAREQAKMAYDAVQTGGQNATGLTSLEALRSAEALYRASMNSNAVNVTDKSSAGANTQQSSPAKTYNVRITLPDGSSTAINTSSDADAQTLIRLLQSSKLSSGM